MKKIILSGSLLLLLIGMTFQAKAQQNVIKVNPLSAFVITANLAYERTFSPKTSAQLGFYYGGIKFNQEFVEGAESAKLRWFGLTPEFRYYVTHNRNDAPRGFYVGPYLRYQNWNIDTEVQEMDSFGDPYQAQVEVGLIQMGGGAKIGYQFLFGDIVSLDLYTGIGYNGTSVKVLVNDSTTPDDEIRYSGPGGGTIGFPTGMALGIAF